MRSAREAARAWADNLFFDEETRRAAAEILEDEERLQECFGQELAFGTGGLRGPLGVGANRMNRYTVGRATQGLADFLGRNRGRVAIGFDTRHGSREFAETTAGVLAQNGILAYLFDRPLPTPLLSFAVRELGCVAGVMVTASHNPAKDNGYKVYGPDGCQITDGGAKAITECIRQVPYEAVRWMDGQQAREREMLCHVPRWVYETYLARTMNCRLFPAGEGTPLKVVYTALHGTGAEPVTEVLKAMSGVTLDWVEEQCLPNGDFPTCPKPNPELRETLTLGLETAKREQADLLLATDPDCDRVGVAMRKGNGEYEVLTGNEVGLLLLDHVLRSRTQQKTLPQSPLVVKTIVTSDLAFSIAASHGAEVAEVLTGFKYIGEKIGELEREGQEGRYVFGFEESCGYLAATHVRDKDGVLACLLVTEMAQQAKARSISLEQALEELYSAHGAMENALESHEIKGPLPMVAMGAAMKSLRAAPPKTLAGEAITTVRDYLPGIDGLPPSDVLSYATDAGAKAIVRPSGTEPKVKVYLSAKAKTKRDAKDMLETMMRETRDWLGLEGVIDSPEASPREP